MHGGSIQNRAMMEGIDMTAANQPLCLLIPRKMTVGPGHTSIICNWVIAFGKGHDAVYWGVTKWAVLSSAFTFFCFLAAD